MQIKSTPEVKELNRVIEEFDRVTAGEFDRETDPKTILLYAGAFSPRGSDLPRRLAEALRDVEAAN